MKIYTIDGLNVCDVVVDGEASVSTQNFIPGIYLAVVSGSAGDKSFKLVVEKDVGLMTFIVIDIEK